MDELLGLLRADARSAATHGRAEAALRFKDPSPAQRRLLEAIVATPVAGPTSDVGRRERPARLPSAPRVQDADRGRGLSAGEIALLDRLAAVDPVDIDAVDAAELRRLRQVAAGQGEVRLVDRVLDPVRRVFERREARFEAEQVLAPAGVSAGIWAGGLEVAATADLVNERIVRPALEETRRRELVAALEGTGVEPTDREVEAWAHDRALAAWGEVAGAAQERRRAATVALAAIEAEEAAEREAVGA